MKRGGGEVYDSQEAKHLLAEHPVWEKHDTNQSQQSQPAVPAAFHLLFSACTELKCFSQSQ